MSTEFSVLYPSVKIIYVLSNSHKHAFGIYICLTATQELPECSILFPQSECSFGLDASVDSKPYAFIADDPIQALLTLPLKFS